MVLLERALRWFRELILAGFAGSEARYFVFKGRQIGALFIPRGVYSGSEVRGLW